ncbi:hypothetical protein AAFN46_11150 [Pseudomonas sp. CAU 1711]|uniref:hypothetical protein n=1 Tax=Pseudomonas sp. CAU 1711 TaxID=3140356 RepID=UPI0032607938
MRLALCRGLFLSAALGIAVLACAAWLEPAPRILSGAAPAGAAGVSHHAATRATPARVDSARLLLLLLGLAHARKDGY